MNIGFVFSEFQQNVLLASLLQTRSTLDILFVKEKIEINNNLKRYVKKIIFYKDIPYSIRNIPLFNQEYKKIEVFLSSKNIYNLYSWSYEHPVVRSVLINFDIDNFYLLEDGIGSYIKRDIINLSLKEYTYIFLMNRVIDLLHGRKKKKLWNNIIGCSLYDECFPYVKFLNKKVIIDKNNFIKAIQIENNQNVFLVNNSLVFIQQPFIEMGILSYEEYISLHIEGLKKLKKLGIKNIYWKLHPRTDINEEKIRLKKINKAFNNFFNIEIIQDKLNIEELVLFNSKKNIKFFSYYSSSLYVIKKILENGENVFYIYNDFLLRKISFLKKIIKIYKKLNIKGV